MCKGIHPNIDDTNTEDNTNDDEGSTYQANAWMEEWKSYINSIEDVPEGMSLVHWWGVCSLFHSCVTNTHWHMCTTDAWVPLPNMAFSRLWLPCCNGIFIASKCAFSSAGITICKHCNHLDGNIIEALQCIKSFIQQDLMVRVFLSVADEETLLDNADNQPANQEGSTSKAVREAED